MGRIATLDPFEYEYRVVEYEYENIRRLGRRVLMC